jgi:hypothetical protein
MKKIQSGFAGLILLLGTIVVVGVGAFFISKTGLPKLGLSQGLNPYYLSNEQTAPVDTSPQDYSNNPYAQMPISSDVDAPVATPIPYVTLPPRPVTPFVLQPLTITLTDTQFSLLANKYKPASLPVSDLTFTFSDNTIEVTTVATAQTVQGPLKVVAVVENKWFRITKVYVGTFELPSDLTNEINKLVNDNFKQVLASLYLDGLQIESVKGHTMTLSLQAPKGLVNNNGSLNKGAVGQ